MVTGRRSSCQNDFSDCSFDPEGLETERDRLGVGEETYSVLCLRFRAKCPGGKQGTAGVEGGGDSEGCCSEIIVEAIKLDGCSREENTKR